MAQPPPTHTVTKKRQAPIRMQGMWAAIVRFEKCVPVTSGYIAQWLERLTADQQVPGSNPGVPFCQLIITATIVAIIVNIVFDIVTIVSIHHPSYTLIVVLREWSRRTPMRI